MAANIKKTILLVTMAAAIVALSGCTDWKKKYSSLNVEHENLKGLLDRERAEKGQLAEEVAMGQQTIEELQRKIADQQSTAEATGFGEGYNVAFDPTAGTVTVTLQNSILFASGQAELKKSTIAELDHIYSVLNNDYAGRPIDIVGHTDTDPIQKSKWKDNWELSAQRALSVLRYMTNKGVAADQIRAVGCGEARPVSSNASKSGKAGNRRVEIVVHMK